MADLFLYILELCFGSIGAFIRWLWEGKERDFMTVLEDNWYLNVALSLIPLLAIAGGFFLIKRIV